MAFPLGSSLRPRGDSYMRSRNRPASWSLEMEVCIGITSLTKYWNFSESVSDTRLVHPSFESSGM